MDVGRAALRGIAGPLFVGHGTQKLFGWFGGYGPDATGGAFEGMGLRPGKRHALAAGVAETTGGVLLTLGALTPLASTLISSTMITAIRKVHLANGPWATSNGYEYNLALIGMSAALAETGPGRPSVDAARFPRFKGTTWALLSLAAAGVGSYLATSERFNAPGPPEVEAFSGDADAEEPERRFTREPADVTADQGA
jgi:putative oxidoreductase